MEIIYIYLYVFGIYYMYIIYVITFQIQCKIDPELNRSRYKRYKIINVCMVFCL